MGAHDAGDRIAVGESDAGELRAGRLHHQLLRVRGSAQEREIRGDREFEITNHVRLSPKQSMQEPGWGWRAQRHVAIKPRAENPEPASVSVFDMEIIARQIFL